MFLLYVASPLRAVFYCVLRHIVLFDLEITSRRGDTHADDRDAFELYQAFLAMQKEAHERYAARFGPICQKDMLGMDAYCWLRDPWPWEYPGRRES